MRTSKRKENFMHSLRSQDDSCFMAFPMGQDSMWASAVWCSHCIPVRLGGDHPHEAGTATSPFFLARKANCGPEAVPCYLSLPPDHRAHAGANNHARTHIPLWMQPTPTSGCPHLQIVARVSRLGLSLEEPHNCCAVDKLLTPLWSQKKRKEESERPEGMRCLLMPMSQADALGFSFLSIQHIRRDASQQSWYWNKAELLSKKHCNLSQRKTRNNRILKGVAHHRASYPLSLFILGCSDIVLFYMEGYPWNTGWWKKKKKKLEDFSK